VTRIATIAITIINSIKVKPFDLASMFFTILKPLRPNSTLVDFFRDLRAINCVSNHILMKNIYHNNKYIYQSDIYVALLLGVCWSVQICWAVRNIVGLSKRDRSGADLSFLYK